MVQVIWSGRATRDLIAIREYIGQFNQRAAQRTSDRLRRAGEGLASFPHRGRPISKGRRELTTVYPYVIRYLVDGDIVGIISVRHGARRPLA